jgi:HEAT repeat protein
MRAASFYSIDHPALGQSVARTLRYFQNLLRVAERLEFTIAKTQIFLDEKPLTGQPQILSVLAQELFRRRMKKLIFLPDIRAEDLLGFLKAYRIEPDELAEKGGMEKMLAKFGVRAIFANEVDFQKLEDVEQEEEEEQPEEEEDFNLTPEQKTLRDLLSQLIRSDGAEFMRLLKEVVELCKDLAEQGQQAEVGVAIDFLFRYTTDSKKSLTTREFAEKAIRALATKEVLQVKIDQLLKAAEDERKRLSLLFQYIGKVTIPFLLSTLSVSEDRLARRNLSRTIVDFGDKALQRTTEILLADDRWYVKRNMLAILSEIGNQAQLEAVLPLLKHEDSRVTKEAVKTIGRIGGEPGLNALNESAASLDPGAQVQIATLFGARRWGSGAACLRELAMQEKNPEEVRLAAIEGIGKLGDLESLEALQRIYNRKGFLNQAKRLPLRRAALRALVNYGIEAEAVLRKAAKDSDSDMATTARLALERLTGQVEVTGDT